MLTPMALFSLFVNYDFNSEAFYDALPASNQWRCLSGNPNFEHCWPGLAPSFDRSFLNCIEIVQALCIAPVSFGDRDNINAWDIKTRNAGRIFEFRERFEYAIFIVAQGDYQN